MKYNKKLKYTHFGSMQSELFILFYDMNAGISDPLIRMIKQLIIYHTVCTCVYPAY